MICTMDFDIFVKILVFDPKGGFCMGYKVFMIVDFQNDRFSRIFRVFLERFFAQKIILQIR